MGWECDVRIMSKQQKVRTSSSAFKSFRENKEDYSYGFQTLIFLFNLNIWYK